MQNGFIIGDRGLGASGDTHPAWMMGHAVAGPYLVVGASAVGQLHVAGGLPRDDAFVVRSLGPWLAVGVADGVGSRPLSRYGATYVAESLSTQLLRHFADSTKPNASAKSRTGTQASAVSDLAPPSRVEETDLHPILIRRGAGIASLAVGLGDWTKKVVGQGNSGNTPAIDFQQAASIGWWPPTGPDTEKSSEASSDTDSVSDTVPLNQAQTQAVTEDRRPSLPPVDEPNLVDVVHEAFKKTHLGLRDHANSLGVERGDLSCTALALLLNVETGRGAVGQVGDGALVGLTARGKAKELVNAPDTDDPQATYTVNRFDYQDHLAVQVVEPATVDPYVAFYVMTDGVSGDLLYSSEIEVLKNWALQVDHNLRVSSSPTQAAAGLLNWLATYQVKGSWDDRTLVVITRRERNHGNCHSVTGQPEPAKSTDNQ